MILVMDVGNTDIVMGVFKDKKLITNWRLATNQNRLADELAMIILDLFNYSGISTNEIESIVISSVVPNVMHSLELLCKKYFHLQPLIIGPGVKTGMNILYENPREVGADRIVNAVAGYELYGGPLIIIDFGTATTFCAISKAGEYLGGCICPGIKISSDALFERAAKLPRVELIKPCSVIGKNTVSSIQAGLIYGYAGQVNYIVNKMKNEFHGEKVKVIATGGLAHLIADESGAVDKIDPLLTLEGLRMIYERNL